MPATRRQLRRAAVATTVVTAAAGVDSVVSSLSGSSGVAAVALVALAAGVLTLHWISRSLDADADRSVRRWLDQNREGQLDKVAARTGLRPATARLSLVRLARSGAVTISSDRQTPVYLLVD